MLRRANKRQEAPAEPFTEPTPDTRGSEWFTANIDPALVLPRNLSNESSTFHLCHYSPKLALEKIAQRKLQERSGKETSRLDQTAVTGPVKYPNFCVNPTRSLTSDCKFNLGDVSTGMANVLGATNNGKSSSRENSTGDLSDTDTNYSEDYTQMTEVGEGSELGNGRGSFASTGSTDLDSPPVSSNGGWSSSTLSESSSPETSRKPNIHLMLGQSSDSTEDDEGLVVSTDEPTVVVTADSMLSSSDSSSTLFEDREFDFLKTEPVRRSTSLKTYKTPPGTPHKKKAVRFADALGLDLESVRHILNLEDPPTVPKSAMRDLKITASEEEQHTEGTKYLAACFPQPGSDPGFYGRVQEAKVVLENCLVDDKDMNVSGTVRVANIAYHKKVIVRYTINNWLTFEDICASYIQNSNDGPTDRFSFSITVPQYFSTGSRLQFAIMFSANGTTYWDSNFGHNYSVECYAKAVPSHPSDNAWIHFL